ncbi:class I SAM-dependent methyltransferase [Candidatus Binatus sp.]|uniref:class I SAM-dependent methyltransferase n=1 Tax=Candidatus Binatus sp. TaxID=2811406 RepID=UPI003BAE587B
MDHRIKSSLFVVLALAIAAFSPMQAVAQDDAGTTAALKAAIAGPQRSDANKARDKYRHPLETLAFFGIKPDMTVVEISPGTGWYTEILAPFLKDHGKLYEAVGGGAGAKTLEEKLKADPAVYSQVVVTTLQPPAETEIAPAGSADMVLTFRNVHDWLPRGTTDDYFKAFYRALKPGGVLGITDHRADPSQPQDPKAKNGYVRQDYMIQLAKHAGFKLDGASEINANPQDPRNQPVWNLPPTLRQGDRDRDKYLAIGESDRMTLKFIKPPTSESKN